jgi:hypothetical protein
MLPREEADFFASISERLISAEELINGSYQRDGDSIVGMGFDSLKEVSPGVGPTTSMDLFRAAHSIIAAVAVGL